MSGSGYITLSSVSHRPQCERPPIDTRHERFCGSRHHQREDISVKLLWIGDPHVVQPEAIKGTRLTRERTREPGLTGWAQAGVEELRESSDQGCYKVRVAPNGIDFFLDFSVLDQEREDGRPETRFA